MATTPCVVARSHAQAVPMHGACDSAQTSCLASASRAAQLDGTMAAEVAAAPGVDEHKEVAGK